MLSQITIRNFALIKEATLNFENGFTVITGETGSGKSILLGALNLILGNRADLSVIRDQELKTSVEAEFNFEDDRFQSFFEENDIDYFKATIIRREITAQGRSRAFINDVPVQLNVLKALAEQLVHIHSQHHTIELKNVNYQLDLFDALADLKPTRNKYFEKFQEWKKIQSDFEKLKAQQNELLSQLDYNKFQCNELEVLQLDKLNYQTMQDELSISEKVDDLKQMFAQLNQFLGEDQAISDLLRKGKSILEKNQTTSTKELQERWTAVLVEVDDLSSEVERQKENLEIDPEKLQKLSEALDSYNRLLKKHNLSSQDALFTLYQEFDLKVQASENFEDQVLKLETNTAKAFEIAKNAANELLKLRLGAKEKLEKQISNLLTEVKLADSRVIFDINETSKLNEYGCTELSLLFSPNKGMSPKPIEKAASGGELSRFMLVLQSLLSEKQQLPTIIFDEIDTGVSGDVAHRVGAVLKSMGNQMQVWAITHLPQVAAQGKHHFKVQKGINQGETLTSIQLLDPNARIKEVAQLMSGAEVNTAALENAKILMGV
jgi:DNA repair protein RecN (Recombination protein N)